MTTTINIKSNYIQGNLALVLSVFSFAGPTDSPERVLQWRTCGVFFSLVAVILTASGCGWKRIISEIVACSLLLFWSLLAWQSLTLLAGRQ